MDPYVRRVYRSVVGILSLLLASMFVWLLYKANPQFLAFTSAPPPMALESLSDLTSVIHIPGVRFSIYKCQAGDTFNSISQKFHLTEETLRSINQENDLSQPPQDMSVIIPSQDGIFHTVRLGQGLADIARAYEVPLKDVLKANHIRNDIELQPGEILILPGASYLSRSDVRWLALQALCTPKAFIKPTTGRFADGFGMRMHPITHKMAFHEGLDLAPGWGARVVASREGKVIFAGFHAGYGRLIILDHGEGLTSWYAHLDEILVKTQEWVKQGELIGKVGKTGRVTGPHLHFEIRLNGKPQNPFLYLVQ